MATNPEYVWLTQDLQTATADDIKHKWLSIVEGLIEAGIRGSSSAFLVLHELAWGTPLSGKVKAIAEIPLKDLLSAHEGELEGLGARNGGSMSEDLFSVFGSTNPFETSEDSLPDKSPSPSIPDAAFENVANSDESSTVVESVSAEAVGYTHSDQNEATATNGNGQREKQPQLKIVQPSSQTTSVPIEIDFRQLDDGRRLELIEDPIDPTKTKLAVFDGSDVQLVSKFEYRGNIFVPIARESDGLGEIVLPRAPNPYLSTEDILSRIVHLIESCLSLEHSYLNVLVAYVLYSWFVEKLQPPVYLLITGPPQSGKTTLLEVMRLLCRRSLLVGEITAAAILDTCSRFRPTLLIDENEWGADRSSRILRKQLRTGTSGHLVAKYLHKTQEAFGAKILSSLELPDDPALRSRCVHIPMSEINRMDLHKPWDPEIINAANALRGSLLQLRLEKYGSISWRLVPGAELLRPRSRDLLGSLSAALPKGSIAEKSLLEFFRDDHNQSNTNLLSPAQNAVAVALFKFVHLYPEAERVQVGKLAEFANESLKGSGERIALKPRKLTGLLENLGFGKITRSNRGSQRALDQDAVRKIHILARDHDITVVAQQGLRERVQACKLCKGPSSIMVPPTGSSADTGATAGGP